MSKHEDRQVSRAEAGLSALEQFWQVRLPRAFRNLYTHFEYPFLAPCEFFGLDALLTGTGRGYGLIPQFYPFGRAVGEGGLYGFYLTPETMQGQWPVLYWNEDEMFLRPVSSDFQAFLRSCVLIGRYETEAQWPDDEPDAQEEAQREEFARLLHLPHELLFGSVPRNDTELHERLAGSDPQDAVSLCHLGCAWRARGDSERALDFFHRAIEAAPWFGDPLYLLANVYLERDNHQRAVQGWWAVAQRLLPLCTRTFEWNLGENHPEADVYEVAADGLAQFSEAADPGMKADPLWRVVVQEDPYDPDVRESLGQALLAQNQSMEAEREFLNALSLCGSERGKQPDRLYDALIALYERSGRTREAAMARFDRALPRPGL